jgi:hypothetical protein
MSLHPGITIVNSNVPGAHSDHVPQRTDMTNDEVYAAGILNRALDPSTQPDAIVQA